MCTGLFNHDDSLYPPEGKGGFVRMHTDLKSALHALVGPPGRRFVPADASRARGPAAPGGPTGARIADSGVVVFVFGRRLFFLFGLNLSEYFKLSPCMDPTSSPSESRPQSGLGFASEFASEFTPLRPPLRGRLDALPLVWLEMLAPILALHPQVRVALVSKLPASIQCICTFLRPIPHFFPLRHMK